MMAGTTWYLVVRVATDLGPVISAVRDFVGFSKKDVVIGQAMPLDEEINGSLEMERLLAVLTSFFAALAVALVAGGLAGWTADLSNALRNKTDRSSSHPGGGGFDGIPRNFGRTDAGETRIEAGPYAALRWD